MDLLDLLMMCLSWAMGILFSEIYHNRNIPALVKPPLLAFTMYPLVLTVVLLVSGVS